MTTTRQVHIIGAGMAGLSAALQLTLLGEKVTVYESAPYAGGRCRSYFDRELNCRINNGNHLMLSGNVAVQDYLALSQAEDTMTGPNAALFPFVDMHKGERWTLNMNEGLLPFWIFDPKRRVPGTEPKDYLPIFKILSSKLSDTVTGVLNTKSILYRRLLEPLVLAALNTEPENASARLLANLLAQSVLKGGKACHPLVPKEGLSESLVHPCLKVLQKHGTEVKFGQRLRSIQAEALHNSNGVVRKLDFGERTINLQPADRVVLALPPWVAQEMIPGLVAPQEFRSIVNLHYRIEAPENPSGFMGILNGIAEWVFVKNGVVSVTISAADRYEEQDQDAWALYVWRDLARLYDLDPAKVPPWRIVRERRATFAATPAQNARRPHAYTNWKNLVLAGDWTDTSLPSTIEGAIRSGVKAAQVVIRWRD